MSAWLKARQARGKSATLTGSEKRSFAAADEALVNQRSVNKTSGLIIASRCDNGEGLRYGGEKYATISPAHQN